MKNMFALGAVGLLALLTNGLTGQMYELTFTGVYDTGGATVFGESGPAVPYQYTIVYDSSLDTNSAFYDVGDDIGGLTATHQWYGYSASGIVTTDLSFGTNTWPPGSIVTFDPNNAGVAAEIWFDTDISTGSTPTLAWIEFLDGDGLLRLGGASSSGGNINLRNTSVVAEKSGNVGNSPLMQILMVEAVTNWIKPGSGNWGDPANWSLIVPSGNINTVIEPSGGLTVFGPMNATTVKTLALSAQTSGTATLEIRPNGNMMINGATTINARGRLAGDGTFNAAGGIDNQGEIDLGNSGLEISGGLLMNGGLILGDGRIDSTLDNASVGEVRVTDGDRMILDGSGNVNSGEINNFGGTLDCRGDLVNNLNGLIAGRGLFVFNDDLTNDGGVGLSGDFADVVGKINNSTTGMIAIGGNCLATFFDDVEMLDTMNNPDVHVAGSSTAVFFGSYNGGNSGSGTCEILGDLRPGNSPAAVSFGGNLFLGGNANTEIEIGGLIAGDQYDQLMVEGDLSVAGSLTVVLINGFATEPGQQFTIAQVDRNTSGFFSGLSEGAMVPGTDLMITYAGGDGNDIVLFSKAPVLLGDVNLDGAVNLLDVAPFIDRIATGKYQAEADCNEDGLVNLLDVNPFIAILGGG